MRRFARPFSSTPVSSRTSSPVSCSAAGLVYPGTPFPVPTSETDEPSYRALILFVFLLGLVFEQPCFQHSQPRPRARIPLRRRRSPPRPRARSRPGPGQAHQAPCRPRPSPRAQDKRRLRQADAAQVADRRRLRAAGPPPSPARQVAQEGPTQGRNGRAQREPLGYVQGMIRPAGLHCRLSFQGKAHLLADS